MSRTNIYSNESAKTKKKEKKNNFRKYTHNSAAKQCVCFEYYVPQKWLVAPNGCVELKLHFWNGKFVIVPSVHLKMRTHIQNAMRVYDNSSGLVAVQQQLL